MRSAIASRSIASRSTSSRSPSHQHTVPSTSSASNRPTSSVTSTTSRARRASSRARVVVRVAVERNPSQGGQRTPLDAAITRGMRRLAHVQHLRRHGRDVGHPPRRARCQVPALQRRLELHGTHERASRDTVRLSRERPTAGLLESQGSLRREVRGDTAFELRIQLGRLVEMEGPDLDQLVRSCPAREPPGHLTVEDGPGRLRKAGIGHVANENVLEAVCLLAADGRTGLADEKVPLDERLQSFSGRGGVGQGLDGARPERSARHGGPLQHCPLGRRQPIDPGGDHRLHGVWNAGGRTVGLEQHPHRLLDEQRIPLGRPEHRRTLIRRELCRFAPGERVDQPRAVVRRQSLQLDRGGTHVAPAPPRALVEQVGTGQAQDQDGNALDPARQMLDQVEHRLLGPVDVLEDEHERLQVGELRCPGLRGPRDLGRGAVAAHRIENAGRQSEQIRDRFVAAAFPQLLGGRVDGIVVGDPRCDLHHLGDRPVRDPLPVGQAAPVENRRALDAGDELPGQPRLPDPGGPVHRDEVHPAISCRAGDRVVKQLELLLAPDEGHGHAEPASDHLGDGDEPPGLDPVGEAPRRLGSERGRDDRVAGEPLDPRAEQHLAGLCSLLQPRGRIDREPRRERRLGLFRDDLAGLDADPDLEPEVLDRLHDREGRPHRPLGVVFVRKGDAERGHHGIARELLDDAAVGRDAMGHLIEEARQPRAHDLGVGARDELRRADEVDEENRRELPFHP